MPNDPNVAEMLTLIVVRSDEEKISWVLQSYRSDTGTFPSITFVEPNVPLVVRQLLGVMVARGGNINDYDLTIEGYGGLLESVRPWDQDFQRLADWHHFEEVFKMMRLSKNRPFALAAQFAHRWQRRVASGPRRRALERTHAIKQDLMAAAWHPRRMVDWCMDTEEQDELREFAH